MLFLLLQGGRWAGKVKQLALAFACTCALPPLPSACPPAAISLYFSICSPSYHSPGFCSLISRFAQSLTPSLSSHLPFPRAPLGSPVTSASPLLWHPTASALPSLPFSVPGPLKRNPSQPMEDHVGSVPVLWGELGLCSVPQTTV